MNKKILIIALLLLGGIATKMDAFFGRWGWGYGYPYGWRGYNGWRRPYWGGYNPYWRRPYYGRYVQNILKDQQTAEQKKIVA